MRFYSAETWKIGLSLMDWWRELPKDVTARLQALCISTMCSGTRPNWALSKVPWTRFKDMVSKDRHHERHVVFMSAATPWTVTLQAPLSMEFSMQECWSGFSFPSPGDLPNPGIEPGPPTMQADSLSSDHERSPCYNKIYLILPINQWYSFRIECYFGKY